MFQSNKKTSDGFRRRWNRKSADERGKIEEKYRKTSGKLFRVRSHNTLATKIIVCINAIFSLCVFQNYKVFVKKEKEKRNDLLNDAKWR